jgi:hypothetical protein
MEDIEYIKTTVNLQKKVRNESLKIAKRKGISTLTTLVNMLLIEYLEKNKEILEKKKV